MRVSKEQAAKNRERVVEAAGRLFRERGFDGVGIDTLMAAAGLTHGGFYKSFGSKDELIAEACRTAVERSTENWADCAAKSAHPLADLVTAYLCPNHCRDPGGGCLFPALAADAARCDEPVRAAFTDGLKAFTKHVSSLMPGPSEARRREAALAAVATMIGAIAMARTAEGDAFAGEVLAAARSAILEKDADTSNSDT